MKLLICEDDVSTIDVIEHELNGKEMGITSILRAYDGEMAIDVIKKENPELILCDIGMPILRGTEVLKYIHDNGIITEFAFLTCYDKFEYCQLALQYGASDYIIKPFDIDELKACVLRMIAKVNDRKEEYNQQVHYDSLVNSVLRQLGYGMMGKTEYTVGESLKQNGVDISSNSIWQIVFTCADMSEAIMKNWNKNQLIHMSERIHNEAIVNYVGTAYSLVDVDDRFIWNVTYLPANISKEELYSRCEKLIKFSKEHMLLNPVVLISDPFVFYNGADVLTQLYEKIRKIRIYSGKIMYQHDDVEQKMGTKQELDESRVFWHIKKRDISGFDEYIKSIIDQCHEKEEYEKIKNQYVSMLMTNLNDNGISSNVLFATDEIKKLESSALFSKNDLYQFAMALMKEQIVILQNMTEEESVMERAKKYIDENYRENIAREDVAAVAFVTPNYFSKLFWTHMGMNLREYINRLRIEEAKRLLLSTSMSISEIASYVGYYNISYFSTVFRKIVGESPIVWRNQLYGEEVNEVEGTD